MMNSSATSPALRCTLDGSEIERFLELPASMFDRTARTGHEHFAGRPVCQPNKAGSTLIDTQWFESRRKSMDMSIIALPTPRPSIMEALFWAKDVITAGASSKGNMCVTAFCQNVGHC
jgi:hypothetical protein